jgi:hypothetical protein
MPLPTIIMVDQCPIPARGGVGVGDGINEQGILNKE